MGTRFIVQARSFDYFLNSIRRIGGNYEIKDGGIGFWRPAKLQPINVETAARSGFMTDWQ